MFHLLTLTSSLFFSSKPQIAVPNPKSPNHIPNPSSINPPPPYDSRSEKPKKLTPDLLLSDDGLGYVLRIPHRLCLPSRGVMLQLGTVAFEATRLVMIQILLTSKGILLNPITSLYYVSPCCLVFLSVPWVIVEYPVLKESSSFHFDFVIFGTNSLCAFVLNLAVFLLVGKTSALTMNVAGVVKDWLLIGFSWSAIKDTVTPINLFGYGLAFFGVAYYNHAKLQTMKAKKAQKKVAQGDEETGRLLEEREGDGEEK